MVPEHKSNNMMPIIISHVTSCCNIIHIHLVVLYQLADDFGRNEDRQWYHRQREKRIREDFSTDQDLVGARVLCSRRTNIQHGCCEEATHSRVWNATSNNHSDSFDFAFLLAGESTHVYSHNICVSYRLCTTTFRL